MCPPVLLYKAGGMAAVSSCPGIAGPVVGKGRTIPRSARDDGFTNARVREEFQPALLRHHPNAANQGIDGDLYRCLWKLLFPIHFVP